MKNTYQELQTFLKELEQTPITESDFRRIAMNRVNFDLETPLLKHFIACNQKGEPIEKLIDNSYLGGRGAVDAVKLLQYEKAKDEFQQAQKQVLFEGWEATINESKYYKLYNTKTQSYIYFNKDNGKSTAPFLSYSDLTKYQLQTNNNFKELIYGK